MSTPDDAENTQDSTSSAPTRGGVVPPWQRGPGDTRSTAPAGERPAGPPPRGVVSASGGPSTGSAPVTKLQNPPNGRMTAGAAAAAATEKVDVPAPAAPEPPRTEKFVESPTSNFDRKDLPAEDLPDLDAIHHVDDIEAQKATAVKVASAAKVRSAPVQIGAGNALRAAVQIRRIDPWATFKISAVLAVVAFFIWMIAVAVLYLVLDGMGVWEQLNSSFGTLVTADGSSSDGDVIGAGTIFGWSMLIGAINAILLTALATVGSYIYNLCADVIGGVEVTLADLD